MNLLKKIKNLQFKVYRNYIKTYYKMLLYRLYFKAFKHLLPVKAVLGVKYIILRQFRNNKGDIIRRQYLARLDLNNKLLQLSEKEAGDLAKYFNVKIIVEVAFK